MRASRVDSGLLLPDHFADAISSLDNAPKIEPYYVGTRSAFRFQQKDHDRFFRSKELAPLTLAGRSLSKLQGGPFVRPTFCSAE